MPLEGLRGHGDLVAQLQAELQTRPSHAYLFSGPRGVGKALVARGLALGMLCERAGRAQFCCTPNACPTRAGASATIVAPGRTSRRGTAASASVERCECCSACVQTALGVHPDFSYVARLANRSDVLIEQVRDLIAQLGIRPARAAHRVAIIDDAETLNVPAQNALLKTLEEPPGHAIIFAVSASERALLDTVRSRMRAVRFGGLTVEDLEAIVGERGEAEPGRIAAAARLARGSAARALELAGGDELPIGEILKALGAAESLDYPSASRLAQELFASRETAAENFELIARLLEEILVSKICGAELTASEPGAARIMSELSESLTAEAIVDCMSAAVRAHDAIEAMANPRLQAEQWLLKAGRSARGE